MPKKEKNRASERKYHYTYLIKDLINNKYYYGVHSTDHDPYNIKHYHSSSKYLKILIKELGINNFTKQVRRFFSTRAEADTWEHKVLKRMKVRSRKDFYNISEGGKDFRSEGFVTVRVKSTGHCIRVLVDDPYIGKFYDHVSKGRILTKEEKSNLSDFYKGKRSGKDNPYYKIKDLKSWRLNVSKGSEGSRLKEDQLSYLKERKLSEKFLNSTTFRPDSLIRQEIHKKYNNSKWKNIYLYKGKVFLSKSEIRDFLGEEPLMRKYLEVKPEEYPKVKTLVAKGLEFVTVKEAAKELNLHKNTIINRLRSDIYEDYYDIPEDVIAENRVILNNAFKSDLVLKYKNILNEQLQQEVHIYNRRGNDSIISGFFSTGKFLKGTLFRKTGKYTKTKTNYIYEVICPICSKDEYVISGACSGKFTCSRAVLNRGGQPCRCGDPKVYSIDIYIYHIKAFCEKEGLIYMGVDGKVKGKKETKFKWKCLKGNEHSSRVGLFLEKGSRCSCCIKHGKVVEKVNLKEYFTKRKSDFLNK